MGVRLLQTFMERDMRNGIKEVDMQKEVDEYKRQNNEAEPLIMIDLLALHPLIFTNKHEIILGGRYNVYNDRATKVFNRLKSLGCKLIFFTDGPAREEKIPTCLSRRNENYRKAMEGLHQVYSKGDLNVCLQNIEVQSPTPMFTTFKKIASPFGHVFISVLNECDIELADYATKHKALAIISNDTDFLIFKGNWRYWSAKRFDPNNLTTIEYNRAELRRALSLSSDQMPLLATMSGNDYVPFDLLRNFHRCVKEKERHKYHSNRHNNCQFYAVASEIRSLKIESSTISTEQAADVARLIFKKNDIQSGIDLIQSSLKSYDYSQMNRRYESEFIRHVSQYEGRMNYILLANIKYIVQLNHFDLSKSDIKPFFELISPLIRRVMGIVLSQETNATRTFYCKMKHDEDYKPIDLRAEYPQCTVPPLNNLFFGKKDKNAESYNVRLELVCWQISSKLSPEIIKRLPSVNVANAATLLYLVELQQITQDEADCLLLACNCPGEIRDSLSLNGVNQINERDARIAFLFTTVQVYVRNCFYAVGCDEFCPLMMFDGLYFHYLRQRWTTLDTDSLLQSYQNLRLYLK